MTRMGNHSMAAQARHPSPDSGLYRFLIASAVVHVAVFGFALGWESKPKYIQPVYNVTLVSSVPGGGPRAESPAAKGRPDAVAAPVAAEKKVAQPAPPKPVAEKPVPKPPAPKPAPPKPVAAKPAPAKPAPVKSPAKPAPAAAKSQSKGESAKPAAAQSKPAESSEGSLTSALAGVKGLIGKGSATGHEGATGTDTRSGSGQGGKQAGALAEQIYAGQIQVAIQRHWQMPGELANRKIKVVLGLRIGSDGIVRDVWVDESSGVRMFDETALRAVRAASPLPAPPTTTNGYYEVYPRFTPADAPRSP